MDEHLDPSSGEKSPVEGKELPSETVDLRDELCPRPDAEKARKMAERRLRDFNAAIQDRGEWEKRLAEWEDAYYGRVPDKKFPWEGCSNFWVPLTMTGVETYKPRLVKSVLGQTPPILLTPTRAADEERKDTTEQFLNWQVLTELKLEPVVTESAHLFLIPGLVVAKVYWKIERVRRKLVRDFPGTTTIDAILQTLFGPVQPINVQQEGTHDFSAQLPGSFEGGGPLDVRIKLNVITDEIGTTTQVLVEREELIERPQVDLVEAPDFITPVKGGGEVQEMPWCQQRLWLNESQLRQRARLGQFYDDVVDKVIKSSTPKGDQPTTDSQAYRDTKDATEGVEGQGPSNVRRTQWEILEDYRREDIDDDGEDEEIIVWVCKDVPDDILGWNYLDNVYAHGRRPFRVGRFAPVPFRFLPLSFAEIVRGIQEEVNTIHNQRVDYGTIQNLPFFFYKASLTQPTIKMSLRPGDGIPVENPSNDILFPKWQGTTVWGQQEEMLLMQQFERLTGLTDMALGKQPNRVGATRTAAGTQQLLSEGNLRFEGAMQAFQRLWMGIFLDILALDQEYLPPSKEFRVTGKQPAVVKMKDRTEIQGQYDLRVTATSDTLNRQQLRNDSQSLVQLLLNPALIQVGIVGKKGVVRSISDVIKAFNRDPDYYLEASQPILSPEEELAKFLQGDYVSPTQGENFQYHIQHHQLALQSPDIAPQVKQLIMRHLQETMQMMQMAQMAQQMQQEGGGAPPMGQQAQNAQTGAQPQPGSNNAPGPSMPMGGQGGTQGY